MDLGSSSGGAALLLDTLTILVVIGSATGLVLLIGSFRVRKSVPMVVERRRRTLAALVILVVAVVLFRFLPDPQNDGGQGPTVGVGPTAPVDDDATVGIEPDRPLVITAISAAVALAALAALARRELDRRAASGAPQLPEDGERADRVRASMVGARADLEGITDPREAILRAYQRLRVALQDVGMPPRPDDTPRRVVQRALAHTDVPVEAIDHLVSVFEEARFSAHVLGPAHRQTALAALSDVERSLGVIAPPPLVPS